MTPNFEITGVSILLLSIELFQTSIFLFIFGIYLWTQLQHLQFLL